MSFSFDALRHASLFHDIHSNIKDCEYVNNKCPCNQNSICYEKALVNFSWCKKLNMNINTFFMFPPLVADEESLWKPLTSSDASWESGLVSAENKERRLMFIAAGLRDYQSSLLFKIQTFQHYLNIQIN